MVTIISSAINTGKSTYMRRLFSQMPEADGFICIKTFTDDVHTGYNLLHLPTEAQICFIRKLDFLEPDWQEACVIGENYSFNQAGFDFAEKIVEAAISRQASHFFLDEIGPLELQGKGFARIFRRLLKAKIDLTVAVRIHLLDKVRSEFKLDDCKISRPWELGA